MTPLITALLAFLIAGLVVLVLSGKNPLSTYREIFNGTGLNWFFPWDSTCSVRDPGDELRVSAGNLQQTLIQFTVLVLTGLAVAFAFRCGLFNIGGQGQYIVGTITAVQIGVLVRLAYPPSLHILVGDRRGGDSRAPSWAGIAGLPEGDGRRPRGDHDDHAELDRHLGRVVSHRLRRTAPATRLRPSRGFPSNDRPRGPSCPSSGATRLLQGLHIGLFVALGALVVYSIVLNRTTLGYEVRAVGFNPEAARVRRHQRHAQLLTGDGDLGRVRRR